MPAGRGISRDDLIEELTAIPLGGRPDVELAAHNIIANLIAALDNRTTMPAGNA
jgi:hypothetical protein